MTIGPDTKDRPFAMKKAEAPEEFKCKAEDAGGRVRQEQMSIRRDIQREGMKVKALTSQRLERMTHQERRPNQSEQTRAHRATTWRRVSRQVEEQRRPGGDEMAEGEGESDMEVRRHRKSLVLRAPTREEVMSHLPLHLPFRSWCPVCVQAAGVQN